ncbi:MAG: riboflavin biosynthesis protein RibF [Verrucomicrobiota bacterium]
MNSYHPESFSTLAAIKRPIHLAIGMFDGIHLGHQSVIYSAIRSAELDGGLSGILTFDPHPSHLFRPENPTPQIYPARVKEELLREIGVDLALIQTFDHKFSKLTAKEFVGWLRGIVPSLSSVSVGENFRFGKGRSGSPKVLVESLRSHGISVYSCERVQLDGEPISSTRIRSYLADRPIEEVNALLGRPYHSIGEVQKGKQLGRTLGFPTLNMPVEHELIPTLGVYLVRYRVLAPQPSVLRPAVANFGRRPTVEERDLPLLEVHSLEDCPASYGDTLLVEWIRLLRPERKFSGVEELKDAIGRDRELALAQIAQNPSLCNTT